jgi:hypothetical protein
MTAILQGQLEKGFFLIHSAYEEDVLTNDNPLPNTPAFKTVSLAYEDKDNLLFSLVTAWANYLEVFINNYKTITRREFSLGTFRTSFLNRPPDRETLFSFTYTLARVYDFNLLPISILRGTFTSISEMNLLFDLVLVIDSVIYSSITSPAKGDWRFINLADIVLRKSMISNDSKENINHFTQINDMKENDFSGTIKDLLDCNLVYSDTKIPVKLECDLGIAYCLRNYSAHRIGSFPVIRERYKEILQSVFNVLFLAVETK